MPNTQQELKGDEKSFPFSFWCFLLSSLFHGSKETFSIENMKIAFAVDETFLFKWLNHIEHAVTYLAE